MKWNWDKDAEAMVRRAIAGASKHAAQRIAEDLTIQIFDFPGEIASPIEAVFYAWWDSVDRLDVLSRFELVPQHEVTVAGHRYRLDFLLQPDISCMSEQFNWAGGYYDASSPPQSLIVMAAERFPLIAVELDGHEFHERTPEQVAHRNQRDRDLQANGWLLLHFSGSELLRDPVKCITQARDLAERHWHQAMGAARGVTL